MAVVLGRHFEDFQEGTVFETLARTMTEADIVTFCGFTGDFNPLHTDAVFASQSRFGGRIAHGMCGFSMATGLLVRLNILEETVVAFSRIENWGFRSPIAIGDTIHVVAKVTQTRESRKGRQGFVSFELDVINQKGLSTMRGTITTLMKMRH